MFLWSTRNANANRLERRAASVAHSCWAVYLMLTLLLRPVMALMGLTALRVIWVCSAVVSASPSAAALSLAIVLKALCWSARWALSVLSACLRAALLWRKCLAQDASAGARPDAAGAAHWGDALLFCGYRMGYPLAHPRMDGGFPTGSVTAR